MTAMRTAAQEQVAKSIQSIGIRRVSVQWSFASVLTDLPESTEGGFGRRLLPSSVRGIENTLLCCCNLLARSVR